MIHKDLPPRITVKQEQYGFEVWLDDDTVETEGPGTCVGFGETLDEALTCAEDDLEDALQEVRELRGLRPKCYPPVPPEEHPTP
jgi:predicted RNase H-like HicB family nuclease